jgi:hypothetical protein
MATSDNQAYPQELRRADQRRGRLDGEKRIPSLSEVRRQQEALEKTGGQLTVGYQVVLLAELNDRANALQPAFRRTQRDAEQEINQHEDRIVQAREDLRRLRDLLAAAQLPLTPEELLPRNPEEETWAASRLRNRREVARARRIALARRDVGDARERLTQRCSELASAQRRRDEALAQFAVRVRRLVQLYQQRYATYADALARSHPDGKTLYPLLTLHRIPFPDWVPRETLEMSET